MRGSSQLDVFLEAVLRLDTPESVAFVERVRTLADDARSHAKHSTSQRRAPCLRERDERPPSPSVTRRSWWDCLSIRSKRFAICWPVAGYPSWVMRSASRYASGATIRRIRIIRPQALACALARLNSAFMYAK